jgi:hypothetical protein
MWSHRADGLSGACSLPPRHLLAAMTSSPSATPAWAETAYRHLWLEQKEPIEEIHGVKCVTQMLTPPRTEPYDYQPKAVLARQEYDLIWDYLQREWNNTSGLVVWGHPGIGEHLLHRASAG